ncbi:MAG: hypothetical protein AAGI70_14990 [Pseudomonadota bacterium]
MDKFTASKMLETLVDPTKPYIWLVVAPVVLLVALGRPKLAVMWSFLAIGWLVFASPAV